MESDPVLRLVASLEVKSIQDRNDIEKKLVENSSIFHWFWILNWRGVIHVESMLFFPLGFLLS